MSAGSPTTTRELPRPDLTPAAEPPSRAAELSPRSRLRSGLVSAGVLSILLGGLLLALPGLDSIGHRVAHAQWGWVVAGAGLELASCLGYVLAFQGIFKEVPARFAALVAAAEQAFGAVVPAGGAGGIAAGGWLLSRAGMPLRVIAERSAVLFLSTSATNVATLVLAGAGLAVGVFAGPRDLALSAMPAGVGLAVLVPFLALATRASGHPRVGASLLSRLLRSTAEASATTLRAIRRPGWRLALGALSYLLSDVAALWLSIHALGYDVRVAPLLLAYLIGYLANAIPIPGGVGVLDGGLAGALLLYHVPAPAALGGVLLYHALALWIPTFLGTVGFIAAQRQISSGGVTTALAHARGGCSLAASVDGDIQASSAARERRAPSAIRQPCRPGVAECG